MNINTVFLAIVFALITNSYAAEAIEFDANNSINKMLQIVRGEIKKGENEAVIFTTGEFHLVRPVVFDPDEAEPEVLELAQPLSLEFADQRLLQKINTWCETNDVKWVHLRLDLDVECRFFFAVEKQLRSKGIQYVLSSVDADQDGMIRLEHIPGAPVIPSIPE